MAVFNPDVPNVNPGEYTKSFNPISDVPGNKALGTALAGAGNFLEGAINVTDAAIKKQAEKDVYATIDPIRAQYTKDLEVIAAGQTAATVPGPPNPTDAQGIPNTETWATNSYGYRPKSAGAPVNLLEENKSVSAPPALENGLQKINMLPEALAQGKINDTYYTQQLDSAVTKLRAQYPGYREYIDQKVSETTGIIPANAYIKNLMEDINRNAQSLQGSKNKVETMALDNIRDGNKSLVPVWQAWKAGRATDAQLMGQISESNSKKWDYAQKKLEIDNYNDDRNLQSSMANDAFTGHANATVSRALKSYAITAGLDSAVDAATFIEDVKAGRRTMTEQQGVQLAAALDGAQQRVYTDLYKDSVTPGRTGKSMADYMGNETRDKIIASALKPYEIYKKGITDKDVGTSVYTQKMAEAYQNTMNLRIMENKDIGPIVATMGFLSQKLGPQVMASQLGNTVLSGNLTKIGTAMGNFTSEKTVQSWEQPDSRAARNLGPRSLKADVEDAAKKEIPANSGVYDDLLTNVANISSKSTPDDIKSAIIKYSFDPRNIGVLQSFTMDYRDPKSGEMIPGKLATFTRLTSPDITEEVLRLSAKEPKLWEDYERWTKASFRELFGGQVQELNSVQDYKGTPLHVAWNSDKKEFSLLDGKGKPNPTATDAVSARYIASVNDTVKSINKGISTYGRVLDTKDQDVSAGILNLLSELNYVPTNTKGMTDNPQSLPSRMFRALMQKDEQDKKPKKMEDTFKRSSVVTTSVDG